MLSALRSLLLTLWIGSLWTVGYVVAPTLFVAIPDRIAAGAIAGSIFRVEAWLSLICGCSLLAIVTVFGEKSDLGRYRQASILIIAMLACTAIGYFGLQPFMAALKEAAGGGGVAAASVKSQFAWLHGTASMIYLVQSVLGIALVLKLR